MSVQNILYQMKKAREIGEFSQERFEAWRRTIPYTDEQIALVLDEMAKAVPVEFLKKRYELFASATRKGHLSGAAYRQAIPSLVTNCAVCGKKALYRYGTSGRCREHRYVLSSEILKFNAELEARKSEMEKVVNNFEKKDKQARINHRARGRKNGSSPSRFS